jgi:sigma-B regulation protein RsbU (phosphoserine phosphatase)
MLNLAHRINLFYLPLSFIAPWALTLLYERPVRTFPTSKYEHKPLAAEAVQKARRRLLNEPFFLMVVAFGTWLTAAVVYSGIFWVHGAGREEIRSMFFRGLYTGLITITVVFFASEYVLQRRLVPLFFPIGALSMTPGTLRVRIRTRLIALFLGINLIPLITVLDGVWSISTRHKDIYPPLEHFWSIMSGETLIFMGVGLWLTFLVGSNMTKPFGEIIQVLQKVKIGLFESRVHVTSNDEIGYTGDVINEMIEGLVERDRLHQSLVLARKVQENLLPGEDLKIPELEIAGRSVYCDETGGDYYDYIDMGNGGLQRIGVVIADVSDHGISSALLMAGVRSSLRQRASLLGSAAHIIEGVNRQLAKDVEHSGDFVTMFFLTIDIAAKELEWVRAGHDPAIVYDPCTDSFEELGGPGIALGIDKEWTYPSQKRSDFSNGQIILLGTDGIWEVRNKTAEILGKKPVLEIIRKNHSLSANEILEAILDMVDRYQDGTKKRDDITLVIIKDRDDLSMVG